MGGIEEPITPSSSAAFIYPLSALSPLAALSALSALFLCVHLISLLRLYSRFPPFRPILLLPCALRPLLRPPPPYAPILIQR